GRLLPLAPQESHPPGEYLALATRDLSGLIPGLRGVRAVEPVDYEPVLWYGWRGFRLELEGGADVAPYRIEGPGALAWWRPEEHGGHGVQLENSLSVWVGRWPRVEVGPGSHFAEGLIELEGGDGEGVRARRLLRLGRDVPMVKVDGRTFLDLEATPEARE